MSDERDRKTAEGPRPDPEGVSDVRGNQGGSSVSAREPLKTEPGERVLDLDFASAMEETSPAAPIEKHKHPHDADGRPASDRGTPTD